MIFQSTARIGEQRLEDVMHGEDGRTCIDRTAARRETAQLSADRFGAFDHCHRDTATSEVDAGGKAANTCTNDHRASGLAQACSAPCRVMVYRWYMISVSPTIRGIDHRPGCSARAGIVRTAPNAKNAV